MIVEKMCHNPAILFNVKERGYIREGYFADLVLVQPKAQLVKKEELLYKCGWSPFENHTFNYRIHTTIINGVPVYENGLLHSNPNGQRVEFER
jgi:dihydroorotase